MGRGISSLHKEFILYAEGGGGKALGLQGTNQAAFTDIFLGVAVSTFGSLSFKTPFFISASILD